MYTLMSGMRRKLRWLWLLVVLLLTAPCAAESFSQTPGGVEFRDLQIGSGSVVRAGDVVTVHLTGWVERQGMPGQAFFNTHREGQPLQFLVGTDKVLPGWNEGVAGMQPGGRRLLKIPPALGLGARSFEDKVPENAPLVFIVELLTVRPARER